MRTLRSLAEVLASLELWVGLALGLVLLAVASLALWVPGPVVLWAAAAFWLGAVGALVGWNWRLRLLLAFGLALLLTAAWFWLAANELGRPVPRNQLAAFFGSTLVVTLLVALLVGEAQRIWSYTVRELRRQSELAQELTVIDAETTLYKLDRGLEVLGRELQRLRRNKRPLAVVRIAPAGELPDDTWLAAVRQVPGKLRPTDAPVRIGRREVGLILPESDAPGAEIVLGRIKTQVEQSLGVELRAGVAVFPDDAVTAEDLWAEAGYALEFATETQLPVASRRLMSS